MIVQLLKFKLVLDLGVDNLPHRMIIHFFPTYLKTSIKSLLSFMWKCMKHAIKTFKKWNKSFTKMTLIKNDWFSWEKNVNERKMYFKSKIKISPFPQSWRCWQEPVLQRRRLHPHHELQQWGPGLQLQRWRLSQVRQPSWKRWLLWS